MPTGETLELHGRQYVVARCIRPLILPRPFVDRPYVCMLWDGGIQASAEERRSVAETLIDSRCRYVVCGGSDCEAWHDAVDWAYIARNFSETEERERFILTTWHADEPLEEVVWFAVQNAEYDDIGFKHLLVLAIGGDEALFHALLESVRREGGEWHAG